MKKKTIGKVVKVLWLFCYFFGKTYKLYGSFKQKLQKKYNIYLTNMSLNVTITHDGVATLRQKQIIKRGDEDI